MYTIAFLLISLLFILFFAIEFDEREGGILNIMEIKKATDQINEV